MSEHVVQRIGFAESRAVMTKFAQNRNYADNRLNEILSIVDHWFLWHRFGHVVALHCSLVIFLWPPMPWHSGNARHICLWAATFCIDYLRVGSFHIFDRIHDIFL